MALVDLAEPDGRRWTQAVILPGGSEDIDWFRSFAPKPGCLTAFTATATTVYTLACGTLEAIPLPG